MRTLLCDSIIKISLEHKFYLECSSTSWLLHHCLQELHYVYIYLQWSLQRVYLFWACSVLPYAWNLIWLFWQFMQIAEQNEPTKKSINDFKESCNLFSVAYEIYHFEAFGVFSNRRSFPTINVPIMSYLQPRSSLETFMFWQRR